MIKKLVWFQVLGYHAKVLIRRVKLHGEHPKHEQKPYLKSPSGLRILLFIYHSAVILPKKLAMTGSNKLD